MGRTNPTNVRAHHVADLLEFVKECQGGQEYVIVAGDFNEIIGETTQGLTKLCSECHLVDIIRSHHPRRDFTTYSRGQKILDYVLIDPALAPAVTACGYEPFMIRIMGDHRGLYVDFDTTLLLGSDTIPLSRMETRDISTKKPHQLYPYFIHLDEQLENHGWYDGIAKLRDYYDRDEPNHTLALTLDERRIRSCRSAAKKVKRYPLGPYSPKIAKLRNIYTLLNLVIRHSVSQVSYVEQIKGVQSLMTDLEFQLPPTIEACKVERQRVWKDLQDTLKKEIHTSQSRREFLKELMERYQAEGNSKAAKRIRNQMRCEEVARIFQKCANARGKEIAGGLSYVKVPADPTEPATNSCTEWRSVTDPQEILDTLLARIQYHFGQAKGSTWTSGPLDTTDNFKAADEMADRILDGTFERDPQLAPQVSNLLDYLQYSHENCQEAVKWEVTPAEFKGKLKVWDERTASSPYSGIHLGHGKAYYAEHHMETDTEEGAAMVAELEAIREKIRDGHLLLLNYAIKFGFVYPRWKVIVNSLIEKIPGDPKIHRLRTIHLYEWDWSLILGVKWRKLMQHAFDHGLLNKGCHGAVPGRSAIDAVFVKEMEYEICRLTRKPLVQFNNDAKSCYDRIPMYLGNLASRKYGMAKKLCELVGSVLEQARYHIRTKMGISDVFASHSREFPFFGAGQGSSNGPAINNSMSSTAMDTYDSQAIGAIFESPDRLIRLKEFLIAFVDDVENRTNRFSAHPPPAIEDLLSDASKDGQLWHDLIVAINQELELAKCNYHAIHFDFTPTGQPKMVNDEQAPAELVLTDTQGHPVVVQHVPSNKAIKYLGCHKAPANHKQHMEALKKKCDDFARVVNSTNFTRKEAKIFYLAIYKTSVGYSLPVCYGTLDELSKVQAKAHSAMISKCGFNRKSPSAVMYGPELMAGATFFHLYDLQGYGQLSNFLKYWRSPKEDQGTILRIVVSWAQFCVGTSFSIFSDTATPLPHLESSWLASLRLYLHRIRGTLQLKDPLIPPLQRHNDQYIMDVVISSGKFKPAAIKKINYCRLYLNAVTLADICNAAGTHLNEEYLRGEHLLLERVPCKNWHSVHQKNPNKVSWNLWRRACRLFTTHPNGHASTELAQPLGAWIVPPSKLRRTWTYWQSSDKQHLYHKLDNGACLQYPKMFMDYDRDEAQMVPGVPSDAVPVDVILYAHSIQAKTSYATFQIPVEPAIPNDFENGIDFLDPWEHALFYCLEFKLPEPEVIQYLTQGPVVIATDGSANKDTGQASFGWVISTLTGTRIVKCSGPSYSYKATSYRAEGYGLLSVMRFLYRVMSFYSIAQLPQSTLHCDNESMVKKTRKLPAKYQKVMNASLESDWDVLAEIWRTMEDMPEMSRPRIQHIKSHQDNDKPYEELPLPAQLNVDADNLAEQFLRDHPDLDYKHVPLLPTSGVQLDLPKGTITSQLKRVIQQTRPGYDLEDHLCKKHGWDQETLQSINWESHCRALKRNDPQRSSLIKHIHGLTPIGKMVNRYDKKYSPQCPACPEPVETRDHMVQCPAQSRVDWRSNCIKGLRDKLTKLNTHPLLFDLLVEAVGRELKGEDTSTLTDANLADLVASQAAIGWKQLLRGRFSNLWMEYQDEYLGFTKTTKNNGSTWTTDVIDYLFKQWLELWKIRNEERYGMAAETGARAKKAQAHREVCQLYALKEHIPEHLCIRPPWNRSYNRQLTC
jgi:hypothetical protein